MTTLVAVTDALARGHSAHRHTDLRTTPAPAVMPPASQPLLDCPACGLPATVEWRDMIAGTSGPIVQVKVRCPLGRHSFILAD